MSYVQASPHQHSGKTRNTPNLHFPASASSTVWLLWSHYNFMQIIWTEFGHFASMDSSIAISWYVMHVMHISFPTCVYISHHSQNIPMLRNPTLNIQASLLLEFTLQGFAFTLQVGAMKNPLLDGTDPVSWVIDGLGHLGDWHNCDFLMITSAVFIFIFIIRIMSSPSQPSHIHSVICTQKRPGSASLSRAPTSAGFHT